MNKDIREVISKSIVAGTLLVAASLAQFGFNVLVSRVHGADQAGLFFLAFSIVSILAIIARYGLDMSIVRYGSPMSAKSDKAGLQHLAQLAMSSTIVISMVFYVILFALAEPIAIHIFNDARLTSVLRVMSGAIIPIAMTAVYSEMLRAQKRVGEAVFAKHLVRLIPAVGLVWLLSSDVDYTARLFLGASLIGAVIAALMYWRSLRDVKPKKAMPSHLTNRSLFMASIPLLVVVLSGKTMEWVDSLFLGAYADSTSVSLYNAAVQLTFAISMVLLAVNTINSSKFAQMFDEGKIKNLQRLFHQSARLVSIAALPVLALIILFRGQALSLFGDGFEEASTALIIVAIAQFINVSVGSVAYLLAMTNNATLLAKVTVLVNVLNVVLNVVLIPRYGLEGAAIATAASLVIRNVILRVSVDRYFKEQLKLGKA